MRVLITGGAGFIGSHLADRLLAEGHEVRVLDLLDPQVHSGWPEYMSPEVEGIRGDVRSHNVCAQALVGMDAVVHFAAAVGVGQSMYEIERYVSVNTVGTAVLLEEILKAGVGRLLVASSMSIYGEGQFDYHGSHCMPTQESWPLAPRSVYAVAKRDQEELCLTVGKAYGIPTMALRFFNTYGPRQSLSNPYTGVAAIFASRLLNDKAPLVFEDGLQSRDFIHVHDVARACSLALTSEATGAVNVGTGVPTTVLDVARVLAEGLGKDIEPELAGESRAGDVRHCYADTSLARRLLDFEADVQFGDGMRDLLGWLRESPAIDGTDRAYSELSGRGLVG